MRDHAIAFGKSLRRWRLAQGWAQDTAQAWGQECKFPHVFSSQWSTLETARMERPGPLLFHCLGMMNAMLDAREFKGVTTRALMDRLKAAEPIRHPDGRPWRGEDFFACYIGRLEWPQVPDVVTFTDEEAAAWSQQLREWFRLIAKDAGLSRVAAAGGLVALVPVELREQLEAVLFGTDYSGEELGSLRGVDGEPLPVDWMREWESREGVTLPLEKSPQIWQSKPKKR